MKLLDFFIDVSVRSADAMRGLAKIEQGSDKAKRQLAGVGDAAITAGRQASKAGRAFAALAGTIATGAMSAAINRFGSEAIQVGRDVAEMGSKASAVFGPAGLTEINQWAAGFADATGRSSTRMKGLATDFAAFLSGMGVANAQLPALSGNLTQIAADLASFNNVDIGSAIAAVQSGLAGETEPLRRFGVDLSAAAVEAEAAAQGAKKLNGEYAMQAKIMARMAIIRRSMNKQGSTGDLAKTKGSNANKAASAADMKFEAQAAAGAKLADLDAKISDVKGKLAGLFLSLPDGAQTATVAVGGLLAIIAPLASAFGALATAQAVASLNTTANTAATAANTATQSGGIAARALALASWIGGTAAMAANTAALWINAAANRAWAITSAIVTGAVGGITTAFNILKYAMMTNPVLLIIGLIAAAAIWLWANWDDLGPKFAALWEKIKQYAAMAWAYLKAKFTEGIAWLTGLKERFSTIGSNIMAGLVAGIGTGAQWVKDKILSLGSQVTDWFKSTLGINSPSRVFAELGGHITDGLANGIAGGAGAALRASQALADRITLPHAQLALTSAAATGRAMRGPRAGMSRSPISNTSNSYAPVANVTVNSSGPADVHRIAREVGRILSLGGGHGSSLAGSGARR